MMLSPAAAPIAELACHQNPMPILDRVITQEAEIRERCKPSKDRCTRPRRRRADSTSGSPG